ncbi:hypothetical protein C1752_03369 [Acaryochloris thomasi RCC1774]|uniref:Uncharacterized protein n=1 Tax=Acaryochloris thomasi RCC1774 TaxID=1764569 RepID=A0A2W1JH50_9CYAN|nr:hypothetical protein [Acaryochloris thomasi]PZD72848.1 hypothetical protein C1752_03369 [Acaryochloris thomasi RCC1774]
MATERRKYSLLNSQQLEEHLEIFTLDWEQKLANLGWSSDGSDLPSDIGWKEQHHQLRHWLEIYLRPYQEQDRQKLTGAVLNGFYDEFHHVSEEQDTYALFEWIAGWLIEAVTLYALFKPFLSPAQKLEYASPLRECVDIFQGQDPTLFEPEVYQMVNTLCEAYLKPD